MEIMYMGGRIMRTVALFLTVLALFIAGCQQEDQRPITQAPGGPSPLQTENQMKFLKSILKEDPTNLDALIKLGNLSMDSNRFEEAIDAYSRALKIDPANTNVRVDMAVCYRRTGRSDRAVEEIELAIEKDPTHATAHMNLGVILAYDFAKNEEAAKHFERFLELSPNAPNAQQIRQEIERLKTSARQ
jgi:cytochrome c-type biogenesis protein CcmH/NrfG